MRGRGAPVTNLAHNASFQSKERITPSNRGIKHCDDIARCKTIGADAVMVSNHGGRQLDCSIAPISALADLKLDTAPPLLRDSGVRRGSDVIKAFASAPPWSVSADLCFTL